VIMKTPPNKGPIDDCTHCGACRDVCLAEALGGHTITSLLSGGEDYSAWLCSCCWLCQETCPEHVDVHAVMIGERLGGLAPGSYRRSLESVLRCGFAFPIGEEIASVRAAYGLPPLEPISAERLATLLGSLRDPVPNDLLTPAEVGSCAGE
jgi:heterodisulfide reductase subunit C